MSIDLDKEGKRIVLTKRGQLAQIELPAAPTAIYSSPVETRTEIDPGQLIINNRANQTRWVTIWFDDDGSNTTNAELVVFEFPVPSKGFFATSVKIFMDNPNGTISMEAQAANTLIVTIFGSEFNEL